MSPVRSAWLSLLRAAETAGALLLLILAAVFAVDVSLRYVLGVTASWIVDLEWTLVAAAICLSLAPASAADAHVRVDVLWSRFRPGLRRTVLRVGHVALLLPWCAFVAYAASRYTYNSWLIGEGSPDPGGLPFRWAVKAFVPLGFALLGVEGVRQLFTGHTAQTGLS